MADIAFLLLIFFLVATTMNVDTGITRVLPPIPPEEQSEDLKVKERDLLPILVRNDDAIMVAGFPMHISQLSNFVKVFVTNAGDDPNMPSKEMKEIAMPDGSTWSYMVSKGVVSLQSTTGASYDVYIQVQNELTRAFRELREDAAHAKFGRAYSELSTEEQEAIAKAVPQSISEAEPRKID
jgi:hypothetical protein